jgi:hypothetical protein
MTEDKLRTLGAAKFMAKSEDPVDPPKDPDVTGGGRRKITPDPEDANKRKIERDKTSLRPPTTGKSSGVDDE